jgi:CelD/BcsL family acetyltransferase involved in cellulose biosynthesis
VTQTPLTIRVLPASERRAAAEAWRELQQRLDGAGLFCSWTWTATWLEHFGDEVPHHFLLARRGETLVGAVLLCEGVARRRGGIPVRTLHFGTAGEREGHSVFVQYNRLLVDPADRAELAQALIGLVRRRPRWDELHLDGFAQEDADALIGAEPRMEARRSPSPAMDLDEARAGAGDVLGSLRSSVRWRIRRSLRALGPVQTDWAEDVDEARDILEELVGLHQARWTAAGDTGVFASPRFAAFHRALVPRLLPRGEAVLFRARTAERTVGCLYGHVDGGRMLQYQSGLASFDDNRLKPGLVVHALCMQECLERGLREYDLLAGGTRYKRELATVERELVWGHVAARRPRAMLVHGVRQLRGLRRGAAPSHTGHEGDADR